MVTLYLTDSCNDRTATSFGRGMTDKRFLELEITQWLHSPERRRQLEAEAYYDGRHEIVNRRRLVAGDGGEQVELTHLPNNRLVHNLYARLVDQKTNYSFGRPFSFDSEDKPYARLLEQTLGDRFRATIRTAGEWAWLEGKCWICPVIENGEIDFTLLRADEVLAFWADAAHTRLDAAVHVYTVQVYDESEHVKSLVKAEVLHGGGVDRFIRREDGTLEPDPDAPPVAYCTVKDRETGADVEYNWDRLPLVCFKSNHHELPLLSRVKCLQDAYNDLLSNFVNQMEEDVHNTVLVIRNYEGEDLGRFRQNLAQYGAIKVRSFDGCEGGVDTLTIQVNAENYRVLLSLLKDAILENARGYDARDERLGGSPNQLNIRSMYSDVDLDANGIEMEFQAGLERLLWFVNCHLGRSGRARIIFDRDVLVNETETINNCRTSVGLLSDETIVKMHPWVSDPVQELERIRREKSQADPYRAAFVSSRTGDHTSGSGAGAAGSSREGGGGDGPTE